MHIISGVENFTNVIGFPLKYGSAAKDTQNPYMYTQNLKISLKEC